MLEVTTFYLSRVLGKKVFSNSGKVMGIIQDILVDVQSTKPQVTSLVIKKSGKSVIADFSRFSVSEEKNQYVFRCSDEEVTVTELKDNTIFLHDNVLDKQLVDIDGRKLVRVNDVRLVVLATGTFVVAVDVGIEGLLRRLGAAKPIMKLLQPFKLQVPNKLILWDEVETIDFGQAGIKLSTPYSKLSTLHVSDLADIIEDMDAKMQAEVFASFDEEKAADILEELEPKAKIQILQGMSLEKAADLLEKMPSDEVADILDEMSDEEAEKLLLEMEKETSEEVRELMEYEDDEIGSLMTLDFIAFSKNTTVNDTINELRRVKPEADSVYYLYVTDETGHFLATVSLRDIIISPPETLLSEIMNKNPIFVIDTDNIDSIAEIISKYNLLAVPVVDKEMVMVGMVVIDDVIYNLLKASRRRRSS